MPKVYETLQKRGFVHQISHQDLPGRLEGESLVLYTGFDPTADSLHLGHLVPVLLMRHLQQAGHRPLAVVGGATGMVGDPSGRSEERNLLSAEQVAHNKAAIRAQLERFLDFSGAAAATMLDNFDWISPMSFIDWLRDVGKHMTINVMLAKDSVKGRMESEQGISFTEFSYMTMQAYDFLHLYRHHGCVLQCGGSDQWGNITAGIDLIRRVESGKAAGLTVPLITTASGQKFGKSAGNAIWLDAKRTSPFQFYQYFVRTEDADVDRFLKLFTFLTLEEIEPIVAEHQQQPHLRLAQKRLAAEITSLVHGPEGLKRAEAATEALFGGDLSQLSEADLLEIFADVPSASFAASRLDAGISPIDLLAESGVCKSKGEARRMLDQGAVYLNNQRCEPAAAIDRSALAGRSVLVVRLGKKNYHLLHAE